MERNVSRYVGRCLFVVDDQGKYCNEPVKNKCHIVSEKTVLHGLRGRESPEVLELSWGVSQWRSLLFGGNVEQRIQDSATFEPSPKSTDDTLIGRFACKTNADHDNQFKPIDRADPDFSKPIDRFLSYYRPMLFRADQYRLAIKFYGQWDRAAKENFDPRNRDSWGAQQTDLEIGSRESEDKVKLLGEELVYT